MNFQDSNIWFYGRQKNSLHVGVCGTSSLMDIHVYNKWIFSYLLFYGYRFDGRCDRGYLYRLIN